MTDRPVIPFISDVSTSTREAWLKHLQAALPDFQIETLEKDQNVADIEVALVANPDPNHLAQLSDLVWVQSLWAGVETLVPILPNEISIVRMLDP